jgi:methionyl-tRNA formyltransferase
MKIIFITQDDPFYIPHFFREFFDRCAPGAVDVRGIVIQAPLGKKSLGALVRQMLAFYGWRDFLRMGTRFAWHKAMNFVAVRLFKGRFPGTYSLEHFLLKRGIPILHARNVNDPQFVARLASYDLDLVVSVAASQKFKDGVLSVARYGCINVHNSRLPRNRGMLPNFWSLYQYDTQPISGMTVHKMNETLDDGPIVLQEDLALDPAESLDGLIVRTKRLNARLILEALSRYRDGEPPLLPNDSAKATYNGFPTREDVERFRAKGLRLL